jgi:3-oxoacyl-[acyl-carrier protein] reductase
MAYDLSGRAALVTGAAHGIGLGVARALSGCGVRVAMVDVDESLLQLAAGSVGVSALALAADVSREEQVRRAVETAVQEFGGLDILVNNAGICPMSAFPDISETEWDRVLDINLKGAFLFCQTALPALRRSGARGRIINISSVAGQMGGVSVGAHYAASKAGLIGLSKSLAQFLAQDRVTVNCLAPSTIETDMTSSWTRQDVERVQSKIPLGRLGQLEEIAEAVCFLASDGAGFITGATLDINGGLYLR